ncbi:hypothetical protein Ae201684_011107 [Aphanomyces euteiches]|uniref:Uncharacterized protein n=1 Tax=Aphanomyces euteiches TaxID=100861 RepID=A0A6G0WWA5_9STRA|nr:hypothetical protein Ae201684_011107 [Aphanomyces euteiches]
MESEGLKHVFMEILELIRVEDVSSDGRSRFEHLLRALQQVLAGLSDAKRGVFLDDALAMVLRKTQEHNELDDLVLTYVHGLIDALALSKNSQGAAIHDSVLRQQKSLVGCLLSVLGRNPTKFTQTEGDCVQIARAVDAIDRCGVPFKHILVTARWKQFVHAWMAIVRPDTADSTNNSSEEDDEADDERDEDELALDLREQSTSMLWSALPDRFGVKYLNNPSWSDAGIGVVAHWFVTSDARADVSVTLDVVSPYAEAFLHHADMPLKLEGLRIVEKLLEKEMPPQQISPLSFEDSDTIVGVDSYAQYRLERHFYRSLLQAVMTAMVTFLEPSHRSQALRVWTRLVDAIDPMCRFVVLSYLARTCPFPNCVAVVLDRIRSEVSKHWDAYSSSNKLVPFLVEMLRPLADNDFVQRSDAIVSSLSLVRFVCLRDKSNVTGIHTHAELHRSVQGQSRRLDDLVDAQVSLEKSRHESNISSTPHDHNAALDAAPSDRPVEYDLMRLQIMQAAFRAVLDQFTVENV